MSARRLDLSAFPADLRALPQWVAWRYESRAGKPTKVPVSPLGGGRRASSTNPATWGTLEQALACYAGDHRLSGVGFVFAPGGGVVGVDLDNAIDAETGEIAPWAAEIVAELDTYCELSPSGRGLHLFARGAVPPGGNKRGSHATTAVEFYDAGRYFTVTGQRWANSPAAVYDRQEAINRLHARLIVASSSPTPAHAPSGPSEPLPELLQDDAALLEKVFASKTGAIVEALWRGDLASAAGDHSVADLALCAHLAFWTVKDAGRMDRLFRRSGLFRDKWDKRRGQQTYGERTIARAIAGCQSTYAAGRYSRPAARPAAAAVEAQASPPTAEPPDAGASAPLVDVGAPETRSGPMGEGVAAANVPAPAVEDKAAAVPFEVALEWPDQYVPELNAQYAVVPVGGKVMVAGWQFEPGLQRKMLVLYGADALKLLYAPRKTWLKGERRPTSIAAAWLEHPQRRQVQGLTFAPGQNVQDYLNLWSGWGVEAREGAGTFQRFHDFVRDVLCRGDEDLSEYVWSWMAHLVQRPAELPETALVLRGAEGVGKGTLTWVLQTLVGADHYIELSSMQQVTGKFSGHLANVLLVSANEATWGGDPASHGTLKAMITDPNSAIERKGQDIVSVRNYKRLVISSNEDWPVARGVSDRRLVVLDVSSEHKDDHEYYGALRAELRGGGFHTLMWALQRIDLTDWHPRKIPLPVAQHGWDLTVRSGPPEMQWWYDVLVRGYVVPPAAGALPEWPLVPVLRREVHAAFTLWCRDHNRRPCTEADLGGYLKGNARRGRPNLGVFDGPRKREKGRQWQSYSYHFQPLEQCREVFAKAIRMPPEAWDEVTDVCPPSQDDQAATA